MAFSTVAVYFSSFGTVISLLQLGKSMKEEVSSGHDLCCQCVMAGVWNHIKLIFLCMNSISQQA